MRGVVEVYSDYGTPQQKLIEVSNNLIVDRGGEMICDLMTLPLQGSGISSASSIYDASNYTIQAVSFGKAASGYFYNAHGTDLIATSGLSNGRIHALALSSITVSSFTPALFLPDDPDPLDTKLAYIPSAAFIGITGSGLSAISEYGQNVNLFQYGTTIFSAVSPAPAARSFVRTGAWPRHLAAGTNVRLSYLNSVNNEVLIASATAYAGFNETSSMDWRGFVRTTPTTNPASGLVVSSTNSFSSTGEIIYQVKIASGDALVANHYGGITQMGLWGMDIKSMLAAGRTPPYSFHPYQNVLDYRLFSKKTFNKNIVAINDSGAAAGLLNYSDLTVIWRIFFL
jgi:hypothetical protein